VSNSQHQGWLTQEEVDRSLADINLNGFSLAGVDARQPDRRSRIEAITTCLAQSSDDAIRHVETELGLRPRLAGKLPWFIEGWMFAAAWGALGFWTYFAISPAMAMFCLVAGVVSCGILAAIKHSKRQNGVAK